jgi:hypothetical protein
MTDFRDHILSRAFRVVPGVEFNRARRELQEGAGLAPVIYEVTLPETGSWESFRDATFPLLVRYLKAQGIDPEYPRALVVAVFFRDRCYFIDGRHFVNVLCEMEGLNPQALHFRILRWLARPEPVVQP